MTNDELSYKLKYILHELGMNKKQLLDSCRVFSPSMAKQTLLHAINGNNTIAPSIETLSAIIKVCQTSENEKLKNISYDFLLNDNIKEIEANTAQVYQEIGLSDEVINRLKQFNHPLYYDYGNIINYFFVHTPVKYWQYLEFLKRSLDIKSELNKKEINKKKILKIFDNDAYLEYVERNFKNLYELYLKINKEIDREEFNKVLDIAISHFKYLLLEMNMKLYEMVEML